MNWEPREMSRLIELNIGKDPQYIRINGTLVGGPIGLLFYATPQLFALLLHAVGIALRSHNRPGSDIAPITPA
ncbi:hypothetical protein A6V37_38080 [Paraburkholderia ginsengiterrae]|uniref:Uncharacterized protein n=2 Tax=Paraburkholderia ginsengiterrae TaxID=1462993 RepID=A0A1A9N8V0_9BURK|nr:hypothetical protein A6V37_38080 [Paraburkholderia ginsengiterrae]